MKYAFYTIALAVGLLGAYSKNISQRSLRRIILTIIFLTGGIIAALFPPIVGIFHDAVTEMKAGGEPINVLIPAGGITKIDDSTGICRDVSGRAVVAQFSLQIDAVMAKSKKTPTILTTKPITHEQYIVTNIDQAPAVMLPYIPGLGEKARIMFFHVPSAWTGFLAYLITMIFSIRYLHKHNDVDDTIAVSSAIVGTVFTAIAYTTGAIWAKFNWGHFFNWDAREISMLVLLGIYAAYFVLRANIKSEGMKRVAATYAILAAISAVFLVFILPRITISLHPGSQDDVNIGPILSPERDALDTTKAFVFSMMLAGFTLLYSWLLNITVRYQLLRKQLLSLS